LYIWYIFKKVI